MSGNLRIVLTFFLSIFILLVVGAYAYKSTRDSKNSSEWVNHTQEVITQAQFILLAVNDIETAQRGYVITGQKHFLEPYNRGLKLLPVHYKRLTKLIADNESQRNLLKRINVLISQKQEFAQNVVKVRENEGFKAAQLLVGTSKGEDLMVNIRKLLNAFIANEQFYLSGRFKEANDSFAEIVTVILVSISLAVLFILITLYFYLKDHNRRLRSEKSVRESEERIKKFLESLPLGVYVLGADGIPYYTNSVSVNILGEGIRAGADYEKLKQVYKTYKIGTNDPYPPEERAVLRALKGESNIIVEDVEVDKDGVRVPLRINATNITDEDGKIQYAIAVFEDITEVKEAENNLREAKKLAEESSMLKEAFLANMSHEIRTPMNAVIGFTDLLLKRNLGEEEMGFVRTIKNSGENLLRIINDVLDISKIESGLMTFESHPINITELFASIRVMFAQRAQEKNIRLSFVEDQGIPNFILGDPTRLTQIIINLLGNALKFTREGEVTVSAKVAGSEKGIIQLEFSVKDTGIGIPENKINEIFERFTQAEAHTTRTYGGTGLGLNIVKQLVDLQGGKISVSSTEGSGSEFKVTLSFSTTQEVIVPNKKKYTDLEIEELKTLKILLVEDSPINVKFIFALFENYGLKADHAENGKIAVRLMETVNYDLVLMDIEMPEMNGYETTLYIREVMKNPVPIIAMTAHTMAGESEKCLQMGMNGYISKPIREDLLFSKMIHLGLNHAKERSDAAENKPLVNLQFLEDTMRGNKVVIAETIAIFLEQLPEDLNAIVEGVDQENYQAIRRSAHRMKSSVSIMGIGKIEEILEEMEQLAASETGMEKIVNLRKNVVLLSEQTIGELKELSKQYE